MVTPYTGLCFGVRRGRLRVLGWFPQDLHLSHAVRHDVVWALVGGSKHGLCSPWMVPRDLRWVGVV